MSAVVGVDLSSRALDLVKLQEDTNRAEWRRVELVGADAWARTLRVAPELIFQVGSMFWEDAYLVAIEAPYGHGSDILNRVVGAVAASLPAALRAPERCWIVRPDEWKRGLGLKAKPTSLELYTKFDGYVIYDQGHPHDDDAWQNARDAYCLAMWARDTNRQAIEGAA